MIMQSGYPPLAAHSRTLIDYVTLLNVFQACANVANPTAPFNIASGETLLLLDFASTIARRCAAHVRHEGRRGRGAGRGLRRVRD